MQFRLSLALLSLFVFMGTALSLRADGDSATEEAQTEPAGELADSSESASEAVDVSEPEPRPTPKPQAKKSSRIEKADSFIAPPDWEFDGFVAGGEGQEIRSLYYLNDLIYLNVGSEHGFGAGDRVSIFKRGQKIRDPQTGRFLGYEVRRAAASQVTDKIGDHTCSVRILQANEAVEVGDLVRRDD